MLCKHEAGKYKSLGLFSDICMTFAIDSYDREIE